MEYKTKKHRRMYAVWYGMIDRCTNTNHKQFPDYGGRGITVCDRWMNYTDWLADIGDFPDGMSMERVDNDRGYSPDNVIVATRKAQANNRRSNQLITYLGKTQTLTQWSEDRNIKVKTLWQRLFTYKWPVEKALEKVG